MADTTTIEWTGSTFNPWWGCVRVSPACAHCYADVFARRLGMPDLWSKDGTRRFFGDQHWAAPLRWNEQAAKQGTPRLVFCASMADVFEDHPELTPHRDRLFGLIEQTPWLRWQLLTKRPENIVAMMPWPELPANVWIGTSIENSRYTFRAEILARVPAASVRFLSCEPLLDSLFEKTPAHGRQVTRIPGLDGVHRLRGPLHLAGIHWVIGGGESGPKHRPVNLDHARELRDACQAAGVPFFWKQNGGLRPKSGGKLLDGVEHCAIPDLAAVA